MFTRQRHTILTQLNKMLSGPSLKNGGSFLIVHKEINENTLKGER